MITIDLYLVYLDSFGEHETKNSWPNLPAAVVQRRLLEIAKIKAMLERIDWFLCDDADWVEVVQTLCEYCDLSSGEEEKYKF